MIDGFGRTIDYVRISVTDRCDLRCVYCMPEAGVAWLPHAKILRYEDILRLAGVFVSLGIVNFKITGGEPLVRKGVETLISGIRAMDGVRSVTLTTNGVRLAEKLPALLDGGIDGINLSLDTLDPARYEHVTLPAGEYATMYKVGMPYDVGPARRLLAWMGERGYEPAGDIVDICIQDAKYYDKDVQADFCRLEIRIA